MPAQGELYAVVVSKLQEVLSGEGGRITTVRRLALLITGLVSAQSSVVSQMASGLWVAGVSRAERMSILRRRRRTLHDRRVTAETCYEPAVRRLINWAGLQRRGKSAILALDESSRDDRVRMARLRALVALVADGLLAALGWWLVGW